MFNYKHILVLAVFNSYIKQRSSLNCITRRNIDWRRHQTTGKRIRRNAKYGKRGINCFFFKLQVLLCLSNILNRNFRNCKPSKCKNKLSFSVNMISQYDTQVKDSDGIYDPVLYLSYSKMKETVSQFPFAISYRPNIRILARNHGILKRVLKFSWIYIMIRLLNCYTELTIL